MIGREAGDSTPPCELDEQMRLPSPCAMMSHFLTSPQLQEPISDTSTQQPVVSFPIDTAESQHIPPNRIQRG